MINVSDVKQEMLVRVRYNANYLIEQRGLKHAEFIKYCEREHDIVINPGNFSKALKGDVNLDLATISLLCQWLEVDMMDMLWTDRNLAGRMMDRVVLKRNPNSFLITNQTKVFDKYQGNYFCYFYSTVSDEKTLICGKMNIWISHDTGQCNVKIEINTNKAKEDGQPYIKSYQGSLALLVENKICFSIVSNDELGECNFIMFRHKRPNNKRYVGGMAGVLTISAGGSNVPTFHRMLISQNELSESNRNLLKGNLYLNWSEILVEKEKLEQIVKEIVDDEEARKKILGFAKLKEMYEISERNLRSMEDDEVAPSSRSTVIARIRGVAEPIKYNKISQKLDENVVEILEKIIKKQ